jgi:S1-C subfamily serine protease
LRAIEPLRARPLPLGRSGDVKVRDVVVVASGGGPNMVSAVTVVSKREFAADWEYLLDEALFTAPPRSEWGGAALISREGKLVGVGSLMVDDADGNKDGTPRKMPGNMFVPIDALLPSLGDLIAYGRPTGPGHPWLGMNTEETLDGQVVVGRITRGGPAEKAGVDSGDIIVTVNGETPKGLADFYHKIWSKGNAGAVVALEVFHRHNLDRRHSLEKFEIESINRLDHLKLKSSF